MKGTVCPVRIKHSVYDEICKSDNSVHSEYYVIYKFIIKILNITLKEWSEFKVQTFF